MRSVAANRPDELEDGEERVKELWKISPTRLESASFLVESLRRSRGSLLKELGRSSTASRGLLEGWKVTGMLNGFVVRKTKLSLRSCKDI